VLFNGGLDRARIARRIVLVEANAMRRSKREKTQTYIRRLRR
jgi:hypothetical protein